MIEKAFENRRFLQSRAARPLRILAEYLEPLSRFEHYQVANTIVLMGSSRLRPPDVARARLRQTEQALQADPTDLTLRYRYEVARA
ncbi:MAG: lysine decarboxylase, partial [Acidobacteria bacterium]|nr:lysine decarboxylase [Acidobacteriota bacterium]MDW7985575.1 lysine decarboxylase [Acidobacteriota bacterium]